ncbi:MAG: protein-export membrane protein SecF [Candidatus Zambryskibacteria bacterium RIFCSPLOWO2_02_FULL_39_26]|uniref:Protein-export membrane protein SecF n=1 Tax=Candidatus Zambryskibacteria bacterium RIFCSPLOWO2_12_FULL_39_23 TaxID=1802776 RepID=A0A1G2US52_9BACT|nr:MAG: protein-export membrane protein SecF [Candidatus Zambryskibacteria bacterium RIFCSPHIGHO2_02_39_10]OHB09780.1 MAG: protein-export membrane protein SecF [Candidatus Zambryskibacteria bacterium RIFCSPLOWO2_02_FULL_39_26]OHB12209.1 MAG: protein-export membrane protein SecF [Candidatus Zambryskibacteria bacterium RIFCSPLOWO2_12_FULL_39_23]
MYIINHRKIFFMLSTLLIAGSVLAVFVYGFNLGIDFKGGSLLEISYATSRPAPESIKESLDTLNIGTYILSPSGDLRYILKSRDLTPGEKMVVLGAFQKDSVNPAKEERFNSIGPVVGDQLKNKAMIAIVIVIICIVLFITFAFRKVSRPVASWKYGLATIVALAHDVIIPTGIFVTWTHFRGGEIDLLFVTALLAILGYSVHDTIVVFDRVRENLRESLNLSLSSKVTFEQTVGKSVTQTFGRSINTSLTIFFALVALYFIGGESTKDFAFVLLVGIIAGTYSSIFVASPLLVTLEKFQKKV